MNRSDIRDLKNAVLILEANLFKVTAQDVANIIDGWEEKKDKSISEMLYSHELGDLIDKDFLNKSQHYDVEVSKQENGEYSISIYEEIQIDNYIDEDDAYEDIKTLKDAGYQLSIL